MSVPAPRLGLRENLGQFAVLVAVTAFVGAMVGLERTALPLVGEDDFGVASTTAVIAFIASFGLAKAVTNLAAGALAERAGRRRLLIWGWVAALPVPALIAVAPTWEWVVGANLLLGVNQGLTWSMAVVMKIDLVGPQRRGFALGLNEAAGYGGVGIAAAATGWLASEFVARDVVVAGGAIAATVGLALSALLVRDTAGHVGLEQGVHEVAERGPRLARALRDATWRVPALRSCSQAGLVNNLNDALAWGILPLFLAAEGVGIGTIGLVAGIYPLVWGATQIWTGHLSDRIGRRVPIAGGMLVQAAALALLAASSGSLAAVAASAVVLGLGTALVYPTLIAAVADAVAPAARAPAVGVYRFWRDLGYVVGALGAGAAADAFGYPAAIAAVASATAASGIWAWFGLRGPAAGVG